MVPYSQTKIPVTINAEYTFKQPVEGIASITIFKNNGDTIKRNITCNTKSTVFYVDIVSELGYTTSTYGSASINLVFIDPKTNSKAEDQIVVQIVPFNYMLQFVTDAPNYRPGSTISYTLVSKTLDNKPAPNIKVSVTIDGKLSNLTTGSDGTVKGTFKTLATSTQTISFQGSCKLCSDGWLYLYALGVRPAEGITLALLTQK
jgi:hypothetical protein